MTRVSPRNFPTFSETRAQIMPSTVLSLKKHGSGQQGGKVDRFVVVTTRSRLGTWLITSGQANNALSQGTVNFIARHFTIVQTLFCFFCLSTIFIYLLHHTTSNRLQFFLQSDMIQLCIHTFYPFIPDVTHVPSDVPTLKQKYRSCHRQFCP